MSDAAKNSVKRDEFWNKRSAVNLNWHEGGEHEAIHNVQRKPDEDWNDDDFRIVGVNI